MPEDSRIHVLIVDDESTMLSLCKIYLEGGGDILCETAESAKIALGKLQTTSFDAIVSDYLMPGMDGIELLQEIRGKGTDIPFIIFTGRGREEVVIEALNSGADFYLQKGGDPESQYRELEHKIRQAVKRRRAEEALRESEERYRNLVELSPDALILQRAGVITYANAAALDLFGAPYPEELVGKKSLDLAHPDYRGVVEGRMRELLETGYLAPYEVKIVRLDGGVIDAETTGSLIYRDGVPFSQIMIRDVTERKKVEESVRESEAKYRHLFNKGNDAIFVHGFGADGMPGRFLDVNEVACKRLGYTREELLRMGPQDIDAKERLEEMAENTRRLMADGHAVFDMVHLAKDGTRIPVEVSTSILEIGGEQVSLTIVRDLSDRRRAEEALRVSEEKYRTLVEGIDEVIFALDTEGRITYVSPAVERLFSYRVSEILGQPYSRYIHPDDLPALQASFQRTLAGTIEPSEFRVHTGDGSERVIRSSSRPITDDGSVVGVIGVLSDITDRKRAEDRLRESEERYRTLVDLAPGPVAVHRGGKFVYVNSACVDLLGAHAPGDLLGRPIFDFVHPDSHALVRERLRRMAGDGGPVPLAEERFLRLDGREVNVEVVATPITYENLPSVMVLFLDISERKRAEEQIRNLARIPAENPNPVLASDRMGVLIYANPASAPIRDAWSVQVGSVLPSSISGIVRDALAASAPSEIEIEAGDLVYHMKFTPFPDEDRVNIYGLDITKARRFQDALSSANKKLNLLSGITRHDILNQLSVTLGYLSLARKQVTDPTLEGYLEQSQAAAMNIRKDIEFTRDYQDLGMKAPLWQRVDTVVRRAAARVRLREIRLEVTTGPVEVFADPMLENVFFNLLSNAVMHGESVTEIRVSFSEQADSGVISVEDNGAGVPAEIKTQIFESGFGRHTGHGLFLVREILDITGISITETGKEGRGARFAIEVPSRGYRIMQEQPL
jgi:PAS domain S-box-containing protein